MTIKITGAQKTFLTALKDHPMGLGHLDLCNALRGPVREPTVDALTRGGYITHGNGPNRRFRLTDKGRRMVGDPPKQTYTLEQHQELARVWWDMAMDHRAEGDDQNAAEAARNSHWHKEQAREMGADAVQHQ